MVVYHILYKWFLGDFFVDNYSQSYLLNSTASQNVTQNNQTYVGNLPLTATSSVALTLRGVVTTLDSGGSDGIGGATVIVYGPNGNAIAQTTTDSSGTTIGAFTINFNGEQNVYYYVTATATGYENSTNTVIFDGTTFTTIVLILPTAADIYTFYGTIVDSVTGSGIGNVNVNITDNVNVNVNVTTSSDGNFLAYDNFVVGTTYTITANKLGYTEQETTAVMLDTTGTRVDFTLVANSDNYTSIIGRVVIDGSNPVAPIADALVGLYVVREGEIPVDNLVDTVFTDYYGNYTFLNLSTSNTYVVRAIKIIQGTT